MDILATVGNAIELLKKLKAISEKLREAEAKAIIADLMNDLADIKIELSVIKDENLALREKIASLEKVTDQRDALELRDGAYFFKADPGNRPIGPYCTRCYDADGRLMLLTELTGSFRALGQWYCPQCKQNFGAAR